MLAQSVMSKLSATRNAVSSYIDDKMLKYSDKFDEHQYSCISALETYPQLVLVVLWSQISFLSESPRSSLLHKLQCTNNCGP